jgi:hypothetical protein
MRTPGIKALPEKHLAALAQKMVAAGKMPAAGAIMAALEAAMRRHAGAPVKLARAQERSLAFHISTPSERETSTPDDARAGFRSPTFAEHGRLAQGLPGVSHHEPAFGFWLDGAEESRIVHHAEPDETQMRHAMARLGLAYNQKGVIGFIEGPGDDQAHVFNVPHADPAEAQKVLVSHGIKGASFVPSESGGHKAIVLDFGGGNFGNLDRAMAELGVRNGMRRHGKILWEGDDSDNPSREVAQQKYLETLANTAHVAQV